jgi:hypothetical protein
MLSVDLIQTRDIDQSIGAPLGAIVEMMSTAQWGKNLKFKDLVLENL